MEQHERKNGVSGGRQRVCEGLLDRDALSKPSSCLKSSVSVQSETLSLCGGECYVTALSAGLRTGLHQPVTPHPQAGERPKRRMKLN